MSKTKDPVVLQQWHVVACTEDNSLLRPRKTRLLGQDILIKRNSAADIEAWEMSGDVCTRGLPVELRYGHVWTTLGSSEPDIFELEEFSSVDQRIVYVGSISVKTSGLRLVENFLDMAHFPYVHTDILGAEPNTEVAKYSVEERNNEIWAINCKFYQPRAAANAHEGGEIHYTYRVVAPFSAVLYKTNPDYPAITDVVGLFIQPKDEDKCDAFTLLFVNDEENSDASVRQFQQTIFMQDLGILNNQVPARLPLDPGVEIPSGADRSSVYYRRWLKKSGQTFGAITNEMQETKV